jgi:hypothetical protein
MHDFFPLTPSYCLLGRDGQFRGAPDPRDPAHVARRADGTRVPLEAWQAAWHGFLSQCTKISVFSDDSRAHVLRAYSDLAHLIVVRPHAPPQGIARVLPPRRSRPVLAVLGNLNIPKGAGVLRDLALRIDAEGGMQLVLIGNIDPGVILPGSVICHGSYTPPQISALAARYGVGAWLIPSIWPETFSFTTHEALATNLPVHAFDLGAQGQAARAAPNGYVLRFAPDADHAATVLRALAASHAPIAVAS